MKVEMVEEYNKVNDFKGVVNAILKKYQKKKL